ncbi:ABC transporter substrate-binding protein, partial [Paracoccus sp. (in: a-proteobacteria)]|uniref:ABC transporter substrate-binding protein n=1 Tax=Paracoccus sp. TaxID=267 RepID=UPI003A897BC1
MKTAFFVSAALAALTAPAAGCEIKLGMVMELTGPAGVYGQAGAKAADMAFRDLNQAGGVLGCDIVTDTRDSQSQGNVAVDQATQLVNIGKVPVVIGGIISSVSIPILTSVTAPAKVVQVSPASSSPTLTQLGEEGKTGGYFFRTITSDALQGTA